MLLLAALRNLSRNARRTLAVIVTVALGTAALCAFHGFNAGLFAQLRETTIHARYGHGQINTTGYRDRVFERPWEHWINDSSSVLTRIRQLPEVEHVFPRVSFSALIASTKVSINGAGQGVDPVAEAGFFNMLNIERGKVLTTEPDGIMLGHGLARSLDVNVGDHVTILTNGVGGSLNGAELTVVGVFHTGAKDFDDIVFRIPLAQAQTLVSTDTIETISLGLRPGASFASLAAGVRRDFPGLEATDFAVLDKINYQQMVDWLKSQFGVIEFILLSIVVLGIFNNVSVAVFERKQEIGNLRANGESRLDVMKLLWLEGLVLGALGAFTGVCVTVAVVKGLIPHGVDMPPMPGSTRGHHIFIELAPTMVARASALGVVSALIGTSFAGIKVARTSIVEALRAT